MDIIAAFNLALALAEKLIPVVDAAFKRGEVTAEEQQRARDAYQALRAKGDTLFQGPEWEVAK